MLRRGNFNWKKILPSKYPVYFVVVFVEHFLISNWWRKIQSTVAVARSGIMGMRSIRKQAEHVVRSNPVSSIHHETASVPASRFPRVPVLASLRDSPWQRDMGYKMPFLLQVALGCKIYHSNGMPTRIQYMMGKLSKQSLEFLFCPWKSSEAIQ